MWPYLQKILCNYIYQPTNPGTTCNNADYVTDDFIYDGEDLPCTGIKYGDSLTTVLQKLDYYLCNTGFTQNFITTITDNIETFPEFTELVNESVNCDTINNCFTTTTTSTSSSTTTTTTTAIPAYCYKVEVTGASCMTCWINSDGEEECRDLPDQDGTFYVCAQKDTVVSNCTGSGSIVITGGIDVCTEYNQCISTTSTTSTTTTQTTYLCGFMDVTIGDQVWTACNLNVDHYRNGDIIPQATSASEWTGLTTGAWCYYNFDPANGQIYGKLYNWYAINDPRGLAPVGYHIPTLTEFSILSSFLGASAGGRLKETGTSHWASPNTGATNDTVFTGLPGGFVTYYGTFQAINQYGYLWASEQYSSILGNYYRLDYNNSMFNLNGIRKDSGISIRLIKDSNTTTTSTTLAPTGINTIYTTFDIL